ncbi:MAG: YibE/F family protein [Eubacteriales bacterium]|nr:YibE/F family protein [Eubacteriales bacterium]
MKQSVRYISGILFLIVYVVLIYVVNRGNASFQAVSAGNYVSGVVVSVIEDNTEPDYEYSEGLRLGSQKLKIKMTGGKHKGEIHEVTNSLSALYNVYAKEGTKVMLLVTEQTNGSYNVSVYSYDRTGILGAFVLVFFIAMCVIGGKKGIKAVAGLVFTVLSIMCILVPLAARGYDVTGIAIVFVIIVTIVVFMIIDGIKFKTAAAMVSTIGGVLFAGLTSIIVEKYGHLSGYNMEAAENLMLISSQNVIRIRGLLTACILIAALGAVMDVAMSISSAVCEVYEADKRQTFIKLFKSGMNVGRDAMGTMANTLILAFAGSSLNLLLLVFSYGIPFYRFLNTDQIAIEILQAVGGSLGIISAVPIAAAVVSGLLCWKKTT